MKIKLTRKWEPTIGKHTHSSCAIWNDICLDCTHRSDGNLCLGIPHVDRWIGSAQILGLHHSYCFGKPRTSIKLARRDAERLAVELRQDLEEGARRLAEKYCGEKR